ncbi:tetratricopeptide repeat protein [Erythrobacter sp. HKB08]|uniref:tetratricopeptide repeat protein n=1 Tax=Erythrobacter sp. HKB08 TaxID=2502843 RepID=UPI0013E8E068|nr:tetratricopeptide repeat protein [Erythrobacter sp. HKB08]
MTCTPDTPIKRVIVAVALACALAACSESEPELSPIESAREALSDGDAIAAEVSLREALSDGAARADVAAYLGEAKLQQGQLAEARDWLTDTRFSPETEAHGNHMLGRLAMAEGDLPAAGRAFDRSLEAGGETAELWVDIARLRFAGGEHVQAFEASRRASEIDPDSLPAAILDAQLTRDALGPARAIHSMEQALEQHPESAELLAEYAATLGEAGRYSDMLAAVRQLQKVDPGNSRVHYLQAVLTARAGKWDLSYSLLQRSSELAEETPSALLLSGILDLQRANYSSAAQTLQQLAVRQPDNRRVRFLWAKSLHLGRRDRELVYEFGEEASRDDAAPYLQTLVARSFESIGDRRKAGEMLDRSNMAGRDRFREITSSTPFAVAAGRKTANGADVLILARAAIGAGRPEVAARASEEFLGQIPGSVDAMILAGDGLMASRRFDAAQDRFSAAARVRNSWPLAYKRSSLLQFGGANDEALAVVGDHLSSAPFNQEALAVLAEFLAIEGRWGEAARAADSAIAAGGARDPALLVLRAKASLALGEIDDALVFAETAHDLAPMHRDTVSTLANVYEQAEVDPAMIAAAKRKARLLGA